MMPTYDIDLVILSVVIAIIASYTALDLAGRVTASKGQALKLWLAGGATAMGIGIWSMHFVGMLAYKLPVPIAYHIPTVLGSMVAAIIASGLALYIVSRQTLGWVPLLAGGIFMGLGIASMHYIGMAAIRMNAIAHYDAKMIALSLGIAIGASIAALWLSFQLRGDNTLTGILQKVGSASIMGVGIAGMHYTGMAAATMLPAIELVEPESNILGTSNLGVTVALTTLIILGLTLLTSLYDRLLDTERRQLAAIVESSLDAIISVTMDGTITSWNAAATRLYGYSAEEAKGRHVSFLTQPDDRDEITKIFERSLGGEYIESKETVRVRKDGQLIDVSLTISPIKNAAGKIIGVSANGRDISDRKRAEEALKKLNESLEVRVQERTEQLLKANEDLQAEITQRRQKDIALIEANRELKQRESRFRSLVSNVPGAIYRCLCDSEWTLDFISDAIEDISGYPASDFVDNRVRTYSSIIYPEDREKVSQVVSEALEQKQPYIIEYRIFHESGGIRWIYEKGQGHFEEGKVVWLDGAIFDITSRQLAEKKLKESEERFRLLVEGVKDYAILMLDPDGYIVSWNAGAERIKGYKAEEIIGQHISRFYTPEDLGIGKSSYILKIATAQGKYKEENWRVRKDGSRFWASVLLTALRDEAGNLRGFAKVTQDITERKQAEEEILRALEKETELAELRSRFISMTSHEFRTPLATILSSTELLEYYSHKLPEDEKRELFRQIETATKRMTQLLDDILAINKAEAGKLQFNPAPLNLEKFCRETVAEMQQIAGKKHEIVFTSLSDCTSAVMDEKLLRHILTNLLSNAIKYSPSGGIVELALACQDTNIKEKPGDGKVLGRVNAIFKVKDSGIGIPPGYRDKLFSAFQRAENVGNIAGTGLGLSIVKRFVDLHGGSIAVDSEVGVGTTFTVTIPLNSAGEADAGQR